jgi:hypothetical protein
MKHHLQAALLCIVSPPKAPRARLPNAQEALSEASNNCVNSPSIATNSVVVSAAGLTKAYRPFKP